MTANINTFAAANNLTETDRRHLDAMIDAYGHRIDTDTLRVDRGSDGYWVVAVTNKSAQTLAKFAGRFKDSCRASFCANGRAGFLLEVSVD